MKTQTTRVKSPVKLRMQRFIDDTGMFKEADIVSAGVDMWLNNNEAMYREMISKTTEITEKEQCKD